MSNSSYEKLEKELVGEKKEIEFIDNDGSEAKLVIQSEHGPVSMGKHRWKISNSDKHKGGLFVIDSKKRRLKKDGILRGDIGIRSPGFAKTASLAVIVAIAGVIIAILMFKY